MNYRSLRKALRAARVAAGLRSVKDGARHSFGTHAYHRTKDGERGVEWAVAVMGHTGGLRVFNTSYDGRVDDREAEAYFLVYPDGSACDVKTRKRVII